MMDLFSNLWSMGGSAGGTAGASSAPTNMSQIKVQPQAMDLAGTIPAANAQVQYPTGPTEPGTDWGAIGKQGLMGLAQATGGGGQPQQQMMGAPQFRGGQTPGDFKAEDISSANRAELQKYAQVQGLMGQR